MKEIREKSDELDREVFGGTTEKEYHDYWKWQENKGDIIAFALCFGLLSLFLLLAYFSNL